MDVGRSISYVFQDPDWLKKVLVGGLLSIIPIFGTFVVIGYWIRIARNVATGNELPLPEWNQFGEDFIRGLKAFVAVFIWAIPLIILYACGSGLVTVSANTLSTSGSVITGIFGAAVFGLAVLASIAVGFAAPIIVGRVVMQDNIAAAFEFNAIIADARQNAVPLLIIIGMSYALGFVASFGIILCGVGVIFTSFLSYVMLSHLYGQLWHRLGRFAPASSGTIIPGSFD